MRAQSRLKRRNNTVGLLNMLKMLKRFWRFPGSERREIIASYRREFEGYDDGHLMRICRTAVSPEVKEAAVSVLRDRGRRE